MTLPATRSAPSVSGSVTLPSAGPVDAAAVVVGVGLGASAILPIVRSHSLHGAGAVATMLGDVAAMTGTYLLLVMVLLAARIPVIERAVGQDRLIRWHRLMSPAPIVLISLHVVLTVLGEGEEGHLGFWTEAGNQITTMRWIFAGLVAWIMFLVIAAVSVRAARRRFNYDQWWVIHLYSYLALAFSLPHQIFDGSNFGSGPWKALWILLWLATAGLVTVYRIGLPIARSAYHRLEVVRVDQEAPGVYSIVFMGRHLDRLPVAGGQYFSWRILSRDLWWHSHPLSLSAMPSPPYLRVTVKATGDTTKEMVNLRPGAKVAIEGPYGAFTAAARRRRKVALVGAGVGVTPLRALLEDLPRGVDVVAVQRASSEQGLVLGPEMEQLADQRGGRYVALVGPRHRHPVHDPRYLHKIIPDLAARDIFVCGPEEFALGVCQAAERLGVPTDSIHRESFEF